MGALETRMGKCRTQVSHNRVGPTKLGRRREIDPPAHTLCRLVTQSSCARNVIGQSRLLYRKSPCKE